MTTYFLAMRLGIIAGMRSMSAPALLSMWLAQNGKPNTENRLAALLSRSEVRRLLPLMALGEFVGDKLPTTPARIAFLPLLGRVVIGAAMGAAVCDEQENITLYAVTGGVAAFISSFVMYFLRREAGKRLPDPLLAVAEDSLVVALGYDALKNDKP